MTVDLNKIRIYLYIKVGIIAIIFLLVSVELSMGLMGISMDYLPYSIMILAFLYAILFFTFVTAILFWALLKINRLSDSFIHFSFFLDILAVLVGVYILGGSENIWTFIPALIIVLAAFLFDLRVSLIYATLSFSLLSTMFYLEYNQIIPHYSIYNWPEIIWRSAGRYVDYLAGMFVLYFSTALASGYFVHIME